MLQFNCVNGSSFTDVCLNTYGTMDYYVKMLNDNGISPNDIPVSTQPVMWDETLVKNQATRTLIRNRSIIYATLLGYFIPQTETPIMSTYKDTRSTSYTATTDGETVITLTELQGAEIVQIEKEIKPLKADEYVFNSVTGAITLVGKTLVAGETIFIIYKTLVTS